MDLSQDGANPLIVIASNRGPFSFTHQDDGSYAVRRGAGGLVTALSALAERHQVLWIAAAMSPDDRAWSEDHDAAPETVEGIDLRLIRPEPDRYEMYYNVIANPLLWFIQHQLWNIPRTPSITRETWHAWEEGYLAINRQFAEAIADSVKDTDRPVLVFPQDYHLYMVPRFLRELVGNAVQIQPFIHIPWPGPDAWRILPEEMRIAILTSLLQSDRIGFQTQKEAFNFVNNARFYVPGAHSRGSRNSVDYENRVIPANTYSISVDVEKVEAMASEPQTRLLKEQMRTVIGDRRMILRVDRIEPSKNILRGLEAYRAMLEDHPEYHGNVVMLALLVPSRMEVDEYTNYLRDVMALSGMINADFSDEFWEPVRVIVGDNYHRAIAVMKQYDVLLINPIADGMNLVAKEGVLVNERNGVLLLSEHAGAFYELGEHALTVSPYDIYGMSEAMHHALSMDFNERKHRAESLREIVQQAGVREWFYNQVQDALDAATNHSSNSSTPETPETSTSE